MNKIIDPHLHFFELTQGHYQWLKQGNPPFWPDKHKLRHHFHEQSLTLKQDAVLAGFVHIEAGFDNTKPWREIAWLESSCNLPFKTVAGIDLTLKEDDFKESISQLLLYPSVVGCRHILDEQAYELLSHKNVQHNLAYLAKNQLSFDLQMPLADKHSVDVLLDLLNHLPTLRLIINHGGWPPLNDASIDDSTPSAWQQWQTNVVALSQFEHCVIKCSAWEMLDRNYDKQWQQEVITQCLKAFGSQRVMLASNFPLVLLTQNYHTLWEQYLNLDATLNLTSEQITALTYANAAYWYKFNL
ncbi:amidohydrolase family protein [uncultured Shewanella sp.]|uniref:amidohydrolase family protein n=1 Tax=uncultured Shewanella sp. TaxID=173975 RepID=UPI0026114754|nr:amidohydrolase family protein [uncultured Shewanella sp.]